MINASLFENFLRLLEPIEVVYKPGHNSQSSTKL